MSQEEAKSEVTAQEIISIKELLVGLGNTIAMMANSVLETLKYTKRSAEIQAQNTDCAFGAINRTLKELTVIKIHPEIKKDVLEMRLLEDKLHKLYSTNLQRIGCRYLSESAMASPIIKTLAKHGIETISDLTNSTRAEVENLSGISYRRMSEIEEFLKNYGLKFKQLIPNE